jgi:hypothetical protein
MVRGSVVNAAVVNYGDSTNAIFSYYRIVHVALPSFLVVCVDCAEAHGPTKI